MIIINPHGQRQRVLSVKHPIRKFYIVIVVLRPSFKDKRFIPEGNADAPSITAASYPFPDASFVSSERGYHAIRFSAAYTVSVACASGILPAETEPAVIHNAAAIEIPFVSFFLFIPLALPPFCNFCT